MLQSRRVHRTTWTLPVGPPLLILLQTLTLTDRYIEVVHCDLFALVVVGRVEITGGRLSAS